MSGNAWKHITEMSAKVFLELTLKVRLITSGYIMACSGQEVKLALKTLPKAGIRSRQNSAQSPKMRPLMFNLFSRNWGYYQAFQEKSKTHQFQQ